jgi:hypothetical protein
VWLRLNHTKRNAATTVDQAGSPGHCGFGHRTWSRCSPAIRPSPRSVGLYVTSAPLAPQNGHRSRFTSDRIVRGYDLGAAGRPEPQPAVDDGCMLKAESREGDRRRIRKNSPEEASSGLHSLSGDQTSAAPVAHKRYGVASRVCHAEFEPRRSTPSAAQSCRESGPWRGCVPKKARRQCSQSPPFRHRTRMGAGIAGEALPAAATKPRSRRPSHRAILSFAKFLRTHHLTPHRGARFVRPGRRLVHVDTVLCSTAR